MVTQVCSPTFCQSCTPLHANPPSHVYVRAPPQELHPHSRYTKSTKLRQRQHPVRNASSHLTADHTASIAQSDAWRKQGTSGGGQSCSQATDLEAQGLHETREMLSLTSCGNVKDGGSASLCKKTLLEPAGEFAGISRWNLQPNQGENAWHSELCNYFYRKPPILFPGHIAVDASGSQHGLISGGVC